MSGDCYPEVRFPDEVSCEARHGACYQQERIERNAEAAAMNRAPPPLGVALANCKAFLPAERCDYPSPTSQHVVEPSCSN